MPYFSRSVSYLCPLISWIAFDGEERCLISKYNAERLEAVPVRCYDYSWFQETLICYVEDAEMG